MTDKEITHAARQICADQCDNQDNSDGQLYLSGGWDHTVWMRLVEQGIRRGMVIERAAITAWLRASANYLPLVLADAIERGDHIKETI